MKQQRIQVLYELHYDSLLSFANNHLSDPELSKDFVQETFLIFMERNRLADYQSSYSLQSILTSLIYEYHRTQEEFVAYEDNIFEQIANCSSKALLQRSYNHMYTDEKKYHTLLDAIKQLKPEDQKIIQLSVFEEENATTIGKQLDLNSAAVRKRLQRIKKRLAVIYEKSA